MPSRNRGSGRVGRPYLRAASLLRAQRHDCWLCGQPIDYLAPPRTRWSFSLDHADPLSKGGEPLDPTNHRAAHYGCNSRRGNRPHPLTPPPPRARGHRGVPHATPHTSPHW